LGKVAQFNPQSWSIADWKKVDWEAVSIDGLLFPNAAFVFSVSIHSDGGGEADAILYDGTSALNTQKGIDLYCADEEMAQLNYWPPLYFSKGIFLDVGTNVKKVIVQFLPWYS